MVTMQQDVDKQMKVVPRRYKNDYDCSVGKAPQPLDTRYYLYIDHLPVTTFAEKRIVSEL